MTVNRTRVPQLPTDSAGPSVGNWETQVQFPVMAANFSYFQLVSMYFSPFALYFYLGAEYYASIRE